MASWTRWRVSGRILPVLFSTFDTVLMETPVSRATSVMVTRFATAPLSSYLGHVRTARPERPSDSSITRFPLRNPFLAAGSGENEAVRSDPPRTGPHGRSRHLMCRAVQLTGGSETRTVPVSASYAADSLACGVTPVLIVKRVGGEQVVVVQRLRLHGCRRSAVLQLDLELGGRLEGTVHREHGEGPVGTAHGHGVHAVDLAVPRRIHRTGGQLRLQHGTALGQARGDGERVERGLAPGRAARLRHNRGDDVDQLRQTGGMHTVGVLQQGDHQVAEHHGIGGGRAISE